MGIFFNNGAIEKLSAEQVAQLNNLADAAAAQNINEQGTEEQEAVKNYIADLAKREAAAAKRQKELVSSFV